MTNRATRSAALCGGHARKLAGERGFTVTELLIVLSILGFVLAGLSGVLVSSLRAEVDMNQRFRAQQDARLALGKLRRELHCAKQAFVQPGGSAATLVSAVTSNTPYCRAGTATWCAVTISAARFTLYRQAGATCGNTGVPMADYLTSNAVFTLLPGASASRTKDRMRVALRIDVDPRDAQRHYRLFDEITMRGSTRAAAASP